MVFSSIPKEHTTWYYLHMSSTGVAFYQAMVLKKLDTGYDLGTLGDQSLFETYFVCVSQAQGENIK